MIAEIAIFMADVMIMAFLIGDFSATFPGYQRVEVMTFIAAKIPNLNVADARRQSLIIGTEAECRLHPV